MESEVKYVEPTIILKMTLAEARDIRDTAGVVADELGYHNRWRNIAKNLRDTLTEAINEAATKE